MSRVSLYKAVNELTFPPASPVSSVCPVSLMDLMERASIPGLSIAVLAQGEVVETACWGHARAGTPVVTPARSGTGRGVQD
jgi:hypothetical protein